MNQLPHLIIFIFCTFIKYQSHFPSIKSGFFPKFTVNCLMNQTVYETFMRRANLLSSTNDSTAHSVDETKDANLSRTSKEQNDDKTKIAVNKRTLVKQVGTSNIHYFPNRKIGEGVKSIVYHGLQDDDTLKTAVKEIEKNTIKVYPSDIKFITRLLASPSLSCRNLVVLYDMEETDEFFYFSVERANFNLTQFINQNPNLNHDSQIRIIEEISKGLQFLHENNVPHRNIKPENVLMFQDDLNILAKLGDFGMSRHSSFETNVAYPRDYGSSNWMAPEAIKAKLANATLKKSVHADIFSLGMTAYFTLSNGNHPFIHSAEYGWNKMINIMDPDTLPVHLIQATKNYTTDHLIKWMMQKIPELRPFIQQVTSHPMFWGYRKYLDFICELSLTLKDSNSVECKQIQYNIDSKYMHFHQTLYKKDFDWMAVVDQRMFLHQGRKLKSTMRAHSLLSLVQFIGDKNRHFNGMSSDLIQDRFMVSNKGEMEHSKQKYIEYFMELFPDMLIFLFCGFVDIKAPYFASFRETFYNSYDNVNANWIKSLLEGRHVNLS